MWLFFLACHNTTLYSVTYSENDIYSDFVDSEGDLKCPLAFEDVVLPSKIEYNFSTNEMLEVGSQNSELFNLSTIFCTNPIESNFGSPNEGKAVCEKYIDYAMNIALDNGEEIEAHYDFSGFVLLSFDSDRSAASGSIGYDVDYDVDLTDYDMLVENGISPYCGVGAIMTLEAIED